MDYPKDKGYSENNRKAKFYSITRSGLKQLAHDAQDWQRISGVIGRVVLFGIAPASLSTFLAAAGILALVAAGSGFAPAWRASTIDPLKALRYE